MRRVSRLTCCCWLLLALVGCTRGHYRQRADRDAYRILHEQPADSPWNPPENFTIEPDPRSRFFDATPLDDPHLPVPSPRLYNYDLPELPPRDPARFLPAAAQETPVETRIEDAPVSHGPKQGKSTGTQVKRATYHQNSPRDDPPADRTRPVSEDLPSPRRATADDHIADASPFGGLKLVPIPQEVWQSLPASCLRRVLEFSAIRDEYQSSFGHDPTADQRDPSRRLSLEDIIDLTMLNSRPYQSQKEQLYRVALRLSLERFAYQTKPTASGGAGSAANYTHSRSGGSSADTLGVPTNFAADKLLASGSNLLARFANSVVLTFNGPSGFAADVGSELLLDVSHSVFQRDVVFERLTQAERNVAYTARDFARFRKALFRDRADQYYNLMLTYRRIEIATQDYFSNLRAFNQGQAEYRAGKLPRFEVDQSEQRALQSRSGLITSCNSLERSLDELKLAMGLPPEMPLNLDLTELNVLTLRDEMTVTGELVRRARRNLLSDRNQPSPDRTVLLNGALDLNRKLIDLITLAQRLGYARADRGALRRLQARLTADEAAELVRFNRQILTADKAKKPPKPPEGILWRTMDLSDSLLIFIDRKLDPTGPPVSDPAAREMLINARAKLKIRFNQLSADLELAITDQTRVAKLLADAEGLLVEVDAAARSAQALTHEPQRTIEQELQKTLDQVDQLLARSEQLLSGAAAGLAPIEIEVDDAMLTALVQRLDLMNQRGALADSWRNIKLAADDLKSVLNLRASQSINTRAGVNRPFDFTFDESQTRITLALDTPVNRRAQRDGFRGALIEYQSALRGMIAAEDEIKLTIRNDLRQLKLDRDQYDIAVASAALAYERVVSTRLQLDLGVANIATRDFLDAQQAYTAALNSVAAQHIAYVSDRIRLFVDMESLEVDERGFWPRLYDERHQPTPYYQLPPHARPAYGHLVPGLWYSRKMRRMLNVPTGTAGIDRDPSPQQPPPILPLPVPAEEIPAPPHQGE